MFSTHPVLPKFCSYMHYARIGKKCSYAQIGKKYDLMFYAWPVHGEGKSKKVDVTVAHRKVLLADAEHATNLRQNSILNCKII